jgi:hypothetical protein
MGRQRKACHHLAQVVAVELARLILIAGRVPLLGPCPRRERHVPEDLGHDVVVFLTEFREVV